MSQMYVRSNIPGRSWHLAENIRPLFLSTTQMSVLEEDCEKWCGHHFLMNNRHPTCLEIWKMDAWEKEDSFLLAGWNGSHFCDPMEPRCLTKVSFRSPSSQPENNSNSSGLEKKHVMFILEFLHLFWSNHFFCQKEQVFSMSFLVPCSSY